MAWMPPYSEQQRRNSYVLGFMTISNAANGCWLRVEVALRVATDLDDISLVYSTVFVWKSTHFNPHEKNKSEGGGTLTSSHLRYDNRGDVRGNFGK